MSVTVLHHDRGSSFAGGSGLVITSMSHGNLWSSVSSMWSGTSSPGMGHTVSEIEHTSKYLTPLVISPYLLYWTLYCGQMVSALASYMGDHGFKLRPEDQLP